MQYSLLSRFRGALLGSFVGEILGSSRIGEQALGKLMLTAPELEDAKLSKMLSGWSQIADCGTDSLIRCGKFDLEDWLLYSSMTQPSLLLLKNTASSSEAAVATLPLALFFHEDEVKLRQALLQAAAVWQWDAKTSEEVLAVAFAIALALVERVDCARLISRTLTYLGTSQAPLVQQLELVQNLLKQRAGLDTAVAQLRQHSQIGGESPNHPYLSIALAFYCFLSTPEDFRLSVTRAVRSSYQPEITAALTGALSGVYNSIIGIPTNWCLVAKRINTGIQRLQQADHLLAVWSGVYNVSAVHQYQQAAIAAPHVIQPR